jgi:hypothetical protein
MDISLVSSNPVASASNNSSLNKGDYSSNNSFNRHDRSGHQHLQRKEFSHRNVEGGGRGGYRNQSYRSDQR